MRAPLVKAEQHGSIRIQDLTKVVMAGRRLRLAEERLVPFEARGTSLTPMIVHVRFMVLSGGLTRRSRATRLRRWAPAMRWMRSSRGSFEGVSPCQSMTCLS